MAGTVWLAFDRIAVAGGARSTDAEWLALWNNGKPPPYTLGPDGTTAEWKNGARVYRALDPLLRSVARRVTPETPAEEAIPDDEKERVDAPEVFSTNIPADGYGSWPPELNLPTTALLDEVRIGIDQELSFVLVNIVDMAAHKFGVLRVWTDPAGAKLDTVSLVLERLSGANSRVLGSGRETAAPPDTPMKNTAAAFRELIAVSGIPGLKALGADNLEKEFRRWTEGLLAMDKPNRLALDLAKEFVRTKLFDESSLDTAKATQKTVQLQKDAERYKQLRGNIHDWLYSDNPATLLRAISSREIASLKITSEFALRVARSSSSALLSIERRLAELVDPLARAALLSIDIREPKLRSKQLSSSSNAVVERALVRRKIEAEQRVAQDTLAKCREVVNDALTDWDVSFNTLVDTSFTDAILPLRKPLARAPEALETLTAKGDWRELVTGARQKSWRDSAFDRFTPSEIRVRINRLRQLFKDHLKRRNVLSTEAPSEPSTSLNETTEAQFNKGLGLYSAMVAIRDVVLTGIDTDKGRTEFIANIDQLFAAHLSVVRDYPLTLDEWATAWRGTLSIEQVQTLLGNSSTDAVPDTRTWFGAPPLTYTRNPAIRLGSDGSITPAPGWQPPQQWKAPAVDWLFWLRKWPDIIDSSALVDEDLDDEPDPSLPATTLPVIAVEDDPDDDPDRPTNLEIQLAEVPLDEEVVIDWEGWRMLSVVLDTEKPPETPFEQAVFLEATRAFLARFYPVLAKKGPLTRADARLDKIYGVIDSARDYVEDRPMVVDGEPEKLKRRIKKDSAAATSVNAYSELVQKIVPNATKKRVTNKK